MSTYHRSDSFGIRIEISGSIVDLVTLSDAVDLLIDFGAVMVTLLSGTGHGELDSTWMPGANTGNLTKTFVSLTGKLLSVPTRSHT